MYTIPWYSYTSSVQSMSTRNSPWSLDFYTCHRPLGHNYVVLVVFFIEQIISGGKSSSRGSHILTASCTN